jgi:para-aminobenzoate synthetase/4-amino-4-deoxychorismate lyase
LPPVADAGGVFALLDDCDARIGHPTSRLYTGFVREQRCADPARLDAAWAAVDADLRGGLHAVLLADYEWGAKLVGSGRRQTAAHDGASLRVLLFERLQKLTRDEVDAWLAAAPAPPASGLMELAAGIDRAAFDGAIARIHEAIAAGETYQVNFSYRLDGRLYGAPLAFYRRLRERQPVPYGAFIVLPESDDANALTHVLSCSPELFLRHEAGRLTARPMKGTAARSGAPALDDEAARRLSQDTKTRAENLMIVDLLRNDLGRVAQTGSVAVPSLFAVEPYATVLQMTSTVQARLRPEVDFPALLRAVFPCGSITGAPKHRTMGLIAELESTPRGLYCGAIGWLDAPPGDVRCGDFCLSVAIRTLTLKRPVRGLWPARLGTGAGIVQDSRAQDEYEECRLKARFLTGLDPGFELFETMLAEPAASTGLVLPRLGQHLDRLQRSAGVLGFAFDRAAAEDEAKRLLASLAPGLHWRVRLALSHDGTRAWTGAPLAELPAGPLGLIVAEARLPDVNPLAAHKTTLRAVYDEGVRAAERLGAFDSLFFSEAGRLVEGGRSSVFVRLDGRWWTPPLADGALPGVMRGLLLDDPAWAAAERSLGLDDLHRAEGLVVCNALRGARPASLLDAGAARGLPAGTVTRSRR